MESYNSDKKSNKEFSSVKTSAGQGCLTRNDGLPDHNPTPTTKRGKRRHDARSDDQKKRAEKAWNAGRTKQESRYQQKMSVN